MLTKTLNSARLKSPLHLGGSSLSLQVLPVPFTDHKLVCACWSAINVWLFGPETPPFLDREEEACFARFALFGKPLGLVPTMHPDAFGCIWSARPVLAITLPGSMTIRYRFSIDRCSNGVFAGIRRARSGAQLLFEKTTESNDVPGSGIGYPARSQPVNASFSLCFSDPAQNPEAGPETGSKKAPPNLNNPDAEWRPQRFRNAPDHNARARVTLPTERAL